MSAAVPVIALTGFLGAGKTTVLNSVLRAPGARFGVVVNDFGEIDVDSGLITGQVDEAASIAGGCLCCMPDAGGLDEALEALSRPALRLDAILVESSGVAEPLAVARLIASAGGARTRPGGVIEVIDALSYFDTVDTPGPRGGLREPPLRLAAASLVVVTKTALLAEDERSEHLARITERVRRRNAHAPVVEAPHGAIDPDLVVDIAAPGDPEGQLPIAALLREAQGAPEHIHADAVTLRPEGPVDPGSLVDLLEDAPEGVYRLKGTVRVRGVEGVRAVTVHRAGQHVHVSPARGGAEEGLVAIGMHLDVDATRARMAQALAPSAEGTSADAPATDPGAARLERWIRRSRPGGSAYAGT